MVVERLMLADAYGKAVDIKVSDLISYEECYNGTDIWVKDESMEDGKRFYILSISFAWFEKLLLSAPTTA